MPFGGGSECSQLVEIQISHFYSPKPVHAFVFAPSLQGSTNSVDVESFGIELLQECTACCSHTH